MSDKINDLKDNSNIPILNGTNYSEWYRRTKIYLRSKDLLDVCLNSIPNEATPAVVNKWKKASCDAVSFISSKIDPSVFIEVVDDETMEDAHLLWDKINEQYASKTAINRGRVSLVDIASVNIKIPPDVLSYMILGKLCDHTSMYHLADSLAMSTEATENPSNTLNRLQNYARHLESKNKVTKDEQTSTALISSSSNHPSRLVYYCANGVHNPLNTSHKPNCCYVEFPHLRPKKKNEKDNQSNSSPLTHPSTAYVLMTSSPKSSCEIVIDSAATHHMFNDKSLFTNLVLCAPFVVSTGDPTSNLCAEGKGTVSLLISGKLLRLKNCLYIPRISHNLISMIQLLEELIVIERLAKERFKLVINHETTITGQIINGLMSVTHEEPKALMSIGDVWHHRLGHPSNQAVKTLGLPPLSAACETCMLGKSTLLPFSSSFEKVDQPLECVHVDLVGPITPESISGFRYFLTIVDQFTSFKTVRFLKTKSEAFNEFLEWKTHAENLHSLKIKKLVSDKGGEFENKSFSKLATSCGFVHVFAPTSTPEHNGFAERANRTILDKARCLLLTSNLPRSYWAEAVNTASFLSNLVPTPSRDNLSPFSLWSSKPSRIKRLRTFGCKAFILIHKNKREWKLSPTSEEGILLGFVNDNSAYKILRLRDKAVIITRHALFVEDKFPSLDNTSDAPTCSRWVELGQEEDDTFFDCQDVETEETVDCDTVNETSLPVEQCQTPENSASRRIKVIGPRHPTLIQGDVDAQNILPYSRRPKTFIASSTDVPTSYSKAISGSESSLWIEAIRKELDSMKRLEVWDVIPLKEDFRLVGTTWVFKRKHNSMNEITEYKARLCAQGFSQTFGQDYSKTFAPTGRLHSLRTLIAYSVREGLDFQQLDIRSAFLNAPLDEDVYLSIPQGLPMCRRSYCLKLKKAIYGLRQAPLAWYKRLTTWLMCSGFTSSVSDPCVFFRTAPPPIWLFFHVDNIAVFGRELSSFKKDIKCEFDVKDIGEADLMLGIKLNRVNDGLILSQTHYVESVLALYGMNECRPVTTPMVPNSHLEEGSPEECSEFKALSVNYRSAIGTLSYLSVATRPDISFAVSSLSQFLENPGIGHWKAFLHVLHYLKGTANLGLFYVSNGGSSLCAYSDADWGNCKRTRQSVTGFTISFNDCLIIWKTRKQPTVSLSTAEAEYKALTDLSTEVLWLRQFVMELSLCKLDGPTIIFNDNQGCINTASSDSNSNARRMKHVEIQLHFIREVIQNGLIKVVYIPTSKMLADFMTKSVCRPTLVKCLEALNVLSLRARGDVENRA
ncbi:hypothetical protein O181_075180 [Austropuccinia psidii MF-1]|uniref:Integrase catalytic domain-containing protein n=1 Tax=Austropuccinia psidii MF-1 TaxID=1389203 RepID=A0A9Q3IDS4_9BASI|nr:hypothetical protein [Austropuccinia psidii MF-1]